MITTDVENYPGFAEAIQGPWLMEQMRLQAEHVGTKIVSEYITKVDLNVRPFRLEADSGETYTCDALIIATGAQAKWLGLPSEAKFQGFGVSACATCDGFFFRGKDVTVVGGGNTAVEEAPVPRQPRQIRHRDPPPRRVPGRAHPAGAPVQARQRLGEVAPRGGRDLRLRHAALGDASAPEGPALGRDRRAPPPTACSSPSATSPPPGSSRVSCRCGTAATSP
jgi:hypothetical protein